MTASGKSYKPSKVSFYIVAHADDWQLFMQPNAYNDLKALHHKVVFIVTTAGDAGLGDVYWMAREEGLKSSVRFCLAPIAALSSSDGTRTFNSHTIHYWTAEDTTCYFLRLPDGNMDGNGFPAHRQQSLSKFKAEQTGSLSAIDGSATYHNWPDFYTTLEAIIEYESTGIPDIWVNYLNPDTDANPNDHPDHMATGQALQAMPLLSHLHQALFVGYSVAATAEQLPSADLFWKAGMFAAYEKAVLDASGYSTLHESIPTYIGWCLSSATFITLAPQIRQIV